MEKRSNFVLDNAINAYEHTADSALDRCTLDFLKELRGYRDLEEQGLLLRLPCKVGDTIYTLQKNIVTEEQVYDVQYRGCKYQKGQRWFMNIGALVYFEMDFGKTVFLTQAEAEQKLNEMESE